jgi:hypothetical protein
MKHTLSILFITAMFTCAGQANRMPKMAPVYEKGYYISQRGDTVRGEIQVNVPDETEFHKQFSFKAKGQAKPRSYNVQRAKAYGYGNRHYVIATIDGEKRFIRRLAKGRLGFFEYRYYGKVDGYKAVVSDFYIRDNDAEGDDAELRELEKISGKFYKKSLRPYMKDQPMIWDGLDKFNFDRRQVIAAIREFNSLYAPKGN